MSRWKDNPWFIAIVLILGTVAVGGVSFLFTGLFGRDSAERTARLAPDQLLELRGAPARLLTLDWGSGSGASVNDTIQYAFVSGQYTYVVDIDPKTLRPRARWFADDGKLAGSYACPVGATNFHPFEGGFSFILAPGAKDQPEVAALYSVERSQLATFTVPTALGSAGLVERDGTLYAQVDNSIFNIDENSVSIEGALVPVAVGGRQLDEKEAGEGVLKARYVGENGRLYNRTLDAVAGDSSSQRQSITDVDSGTTLEVPPSGEFLGVDRAGLAYVRVLEEPSTTPPDLAGTYRKSDAVSLVLVADIAKGTQWVLPVQNPHPFPYAGALFSVTPDGLTALRTTDKGVELVLYRKRGLR